MKKSVRRGAAGLAAGVAIVGLLAGCGEKVVKKSDLQSQIKEKVTAAATGSKVSDVTCDDDLKAEVKATSDCTVKIDGTTEKYTAVVYKVDGDTVRYHIKKG